MLEFTSPIEFPNMPLSYSQRVTTSFWVNIAGYNAASLKISGNRQEDVFHIVVPDMMIISLSINNNNGDARFVAYCIPFQFYDKDAYLLEKIYIRSDFVTAVDNLAFFVTTDPKIELMGTESLWINIKCAISLDSNDYYLVGQSNRNYPFQTAQYARMKPDNSNYNGFDSSHPVNPNNNKTKKFASYPDLSQDSFYTHPFKLNNEVLYFKNTGISSNVVRTDINFRKFYRNTETDTLRIKFKPYPSGSDSHVFFYLKNLYVINEFMPKNNKFQYQ